LNSAIVTRLARCRRGATALEFALIAPLLFMLVLGTLDVGRWLWARAALQNAVARAARCVATSPEICKNTHEITTFAGDSATGAAIQGARFSVNRRFCGVQVDARLRYHALLPFVRWTAPVLRAAACVP